MMAGAVRPDFHHVVIPLSAPSRSPILRLALSADALSPQLARLLALQRAEEPETTFLLQEVAPRELVRGLEDGSYDVGIALTATTTLSTIALEPLWVDELALAVPLRSPLLAHSEVPLDALLHYPLLRWRLWACDALSQQVATRFAPEMHLAQEVTSFDFLATLVAAGMAIGIAPRSHIVRARGWGIAMRPLANGPHLISTQLLWKSHGPARVFERFAERAAKVAASEPSPPPPDTSPVRVFPDISSIGRMRVTRLA